MSEENENQIPGASSGNEPVVPPTPNADRVIDPTLKLEMKGGQIVLDGKKLVAESDLIAAKKGLETQLQTQQTTHSQAIDAIQLELSAERKNVANLTAELEKARNAQGEGAVSGEEIARIRHERDDALTKVETLTTMEGKALELKKSLLVSQFPGVTAEQLENKTMQELDSLEEALKAVSKGGGIGPYATGGGTGSAVPLSDYDRRKQALESAQVGSRTAPPEQK
jgi:hypothetical protein